MATSEYDLVVIGSGAAGGMAAWNLTRKGAKVLMLEAGDRFDPATYWSHVKPWEARERRKRGDRGPAFESLPLRESPYETPIGQSFLLRRVWGVGGKTNIWGRVSLRYGDLNFTEPAVDGWEVPWPVTYSEIAPYYDNVEKLIGVCGGDDDSKFLPGSEHHLPPPNLRCGEVLLKQGAENVGYSVVRGRRAVLTQEHRGRAKCHYCGACGRGCDIGAFFNSPDYLLADAFSTGNLTLTENAIVSHILTGDDGKANGVRYFERLTGDERTVPAKRVVLAASTVDSTRILLNSNSSAYPNGLGNSSDVIGRYLCEQFRFHVYAFAPQLYGRAATNDDGISGGHIYIPRFESPQEKRDYLRGFGIQLWGIGCGSDAQFAKRLPGFGTDYKREIRKRYPALIQLHPYGEVLPYRHNRVSVEGTSPDRFGVPTIRIEYKLGESERKMIPRMYDVVEEILHSMRAEPLPYQRGDLDELGSAIHEHGTCRMGEDPKRSALNGFMQMHDVPNVFVMDGSAFPTPTEKNPTLSILAFAWRASDYMAEQMRLGEI